MKTFSVKEAKNRLPEVVRLAESGERVTITRNGKPVADIIPHEQKGGLNMEALAAFKRKHGIDKFFGELPEDFDDPLPEDFLLRPCPSACDSFSTRTW